MGPGNGHAIESDKQRRTSFRVTRHAAQLVDRSYAYVGAVDWEISANKFNQFSYGSTGAGLQLPAAEQPLGVNQVNFSYGNHGHDPLFDSALFNPVECAVPTRSDPA